MHNYLIAYYTILFMETSLKEIAVFSSTHRKNGLFGDRDVLSCKGTFLDIEIANSPAQRAMGLMHRPYLEKNAGMLFIFPDVAQRSFWMKNTHVPLSIAYISERGIIQDIFKMSPYSEESVKSRYPVKYALEANDDWFTTNRIEVGDVIEDLHSRSWLAEGNRALASRQQALRDRAWSLGPGRSSQCKSKDHFHKKSSFGEEDEIKRKEEMDISEDLDAIFVKSKQLVCR
jgi:uncharacterized membrane protein (UPF0127 family)